jgi:plastocyanin
VHFATLHLIPILGAEKSKTAFYIAGGLLVAWAVIVSAGLGLRNDDFPGNESGQRAVIGLTVLLVIATAATAVITAGGSSSSTATAAGTATTSTAATTSSEAPATTSSTPAATSTSTAAGGKPTATTGTPAPPSSPAAPPSVPAAPLALAANPAGMLSFNTKQLAAKAGKVTITMANMSPVPHNVTIAQGSTVLGATPTFQGGSKTLTLTLKPGTYTFYCSVPGHRQAGMEGTLTVS